MKGHLQGFLTFLDLMAEGQRRQADLIAGGGFRAEPELRRLRRRRGRRFP